MCDHKIEKYDDGEGAGWACVHCQMVFIPQVEVPNMEATLDAIAGVFSAVLYDYTTRMAERGLEAQEQDPSDECEEHGHLRSVDGKCQRCGDYPFLGEQT